MKKLFLLTLFGILMLFNTPHASAHICAEILPSQSAMGSITLPINVPADGEYTFYLRLKAPDNVNNSVFLQIDDSCPVVVGDSSTIDANVWRFVDFEIGDPNHKLNYSLTKGDHVVKITARDPGVGVDRIVFKPKSSSCVPTAKNDLCPLTAPTPSSTPSLTPSPTTRSTPVPTRTPTPTLRSTPVPTRTPTPTVAVGPSTITPTMSVGPGTLTPTSSPESVVVKFTSLLHGIGSSGDSVNSDSSLSNKSPLRVSREVVVEVFNNDEEIVGTKTGTITYNSATGRFDGTVDLGTSVVPGNYLVKVKTPQFLRESFSGITSLGRGTNNLPTVTFISGDTNGDNVLNILDYNFILGCYSDLAPAKACDAVQKLNTDLDDDGKVNQRDYNLFLREVSRRQGS